MKKHPLHNFRRSPDSNFANNLYRQLQTLPAQEETSTAVSPSDSSSSPRRTYRLAKTLAFTLLLLLVMGMVPRVREKFETIIQQVGELTLRITDEYPGFDNPNIIPNDIMSLDQARERLDVSFELPTWVPEGLVLNEDEIIVTNIGAGIVLRWKDEAVRGRAFSLLVDEADPDVEYVVGPDSVTEVMVNDQPAALIHGGWYENKKAWYDDGSRTLRWHSDGVEYNLRTGDPDLNGLTDEELIRIAESIPSPD